MLTASDQKEMHITFFTTVSLTLANGLVFWQLRACQPSQITPQTTFINALNNTSKRSPPTTQRSFLLSQAKKQHDADR